MKLYHYVHCPFCIRVRMGLGLLKLSYQSIVTAYDDEKTPIDLTGKKMLPIMVDDAGQAKNESLDILKALDTKDELNWKHLESNLEIINTLLDKLGSPVHSMAMPYWIWTPEFNENSRNYFQTKKEIKRGPFKLLVRDQNKFARELDKVIEDQLSRELTPFFKSEKLTIIDLMIASHLWGMYVVPEYQFQPLIHQYLMKVKELTQFNYHEDFWR